METHISTVHTAFVSEAEEALQGLLGPSHTLTSEGFRRATRTASLLLGVSREEAIGVFFRAPSLAAAVIAAPPGALARAVVALRARRAEMDLAALIMAEPQLLLAEMAAAMDTDAVAAAAAGVGDGQG